MKTNFQPDALYYGDCLEIISGWDAECIDLIYLDPPFNSNRNYALLFGKQVDLEGGRNAQAWAFEDTWHWNEKSISRIDRLKKAAMMPIETITGLELIHGPSAELSYLGYMAERLVALKHILKSTGSIYLHCDPTMSHSLKLLMDGIFGKENFRNEIVWHYPNRLSQKGFPFPKLHDTILCYSQTYNFVKKELLDDKWKPSKAQQRREKKGWEFYKGTLVVYDEKKAKADGQDLSGKSHKVSFGKTGRKRVNSVWIIDAIASLAKERCGYRTQKPLELLKRIINASSNANHIVLDPFCGCGTACVAAAQLGRKFIGIDISSFAVEQVVAKRLKTGSHKKGKIEVLGIPADFETCCRLMKNADRKTRFKFERWAVNKIPGMIPNIKQVGDGGIDGQGRLVGKPITRKGEKLSRRVLAQVKSGGVSADSIRAFSNVIRSHNAWAGVFITLEPVSSRTMQQARNEMGSFTIQGSGRDYLRMQSWSMREWFEKKELKERLPDLPSLADFYTGKPIDLELWD